ncbi:hypothetical protein FSC37_22940 [Piscinibacter aquaticus]|uniref:Uncharacterized protein n=1 Tax=Piscinibacter aquaticus TaxID=392597 RepID=A0A5C6TQX6_9BURK|nr:hypothetical protein FSC37_22940 [Piscinibacter aquaticus]
MLDHLADDARRAHAPALVFGPAGRMTGQNRGALTEGELRADCRACGLHDAECQPLPGGASVLRAQRPTWWTEVSTGQRAGALRIICRP